MRWKISIEGSDEKDRSTTWDHAERLAYQPPIQPRQTIISPFVQVPLFQRAA